MSRRYLVLLLILLSAFALRVYGLEQRTVWYDEAFSVFLSERDVPDILRGTAADIQPPLYYLLLHVWQMLGKQTYFLRFLSVAFSLSSLPVVYAIARRLLSPRAGLYAVLLVAISPFQVHYAQELRMYSLLGLALLIYFLAFARLVQGNSRWINTLLIGIGAAAALYSQSLAVLTCVVPDVYVLFRRDRRAIRSLLIGQGLGVLLFSPWLVVLAGQMTNIQRAYWTTRPGLVEAVQLLLAFTTDQPLPTWFLPAALFATLALDAILALEILRLNRRGWSRQVGLILGFAVVPPVLMFALSFALRSVFVVRAAILSSIAYAMLLAWLLARVSSVGARRALATIGVVIAAVALSFQYDYAEFPRSPFAAADAYLRANVQSDDVIVHDNKLSYFPMHYYDRPLPQAWLPDPPGAGSNTLAPETMQVMRMFPTALADAAQHSRIWFVIFHRAIEEAQAEGRAQPNLAWLDQHLQRVDMRRFNDLDVFLFKSPHR